MVKDLSKILIILFGMLTAAACQNSDDLPEREKSASLSLIVKSAESSTATRGIEDLDDDGTVSDNELIVDGQKMYRLAVFLFDGNTAVKSHVLENDDPRFSNGNTEAIVNFTNLDYRKTYRLYAVANYGSYGELTGNLADVNESNVTGSLKLTSSGDNLCSHSTPYPLVMKQDINLMPGANYVNGELTRTYARVRINVRNQSSLNDLFITKLKFADRFTQKEADLFIEGGAADASPVAESDDAITPFEQEMMIPKIGDDASVSESTVFDSYMLESTGGSYNYTLGLKYMGGSEEVYTVSSTAITNANNIEDGAMYIMYNTNSRRYLYANGSSVGTSTSYQTNGELNHNYVWRFNRSSSTNRYTIESMGATGYYMQSSNVSTSRVPLTVNPGSSDYFTASTSSNNIRLQSTKSSYYLSVNNNAAIGNNSNSSSAQRRNNFYLYKVTKELVASDIEHEETIPINIVDKSSGAASPLTAVRRNDFIDILVSVTYNEKTGDVEFEVSDWDEVNGEVTFD